MLESPDVDGSDPLLTNDEETANVARGDLPNIFISYRWNETKEQVREVADYLKSLNKYNVWIDTEEMYGDKNERMEEGIRKAAVVVIFFSDDYQKSRDCRKEAESADRNNKPMVFVKMQRPKCEFQTWFAPIISTTIFVDYFKFKSPCQEICKHIDRVLSDLQQPQVEDNKSTTTKNGVSRQARFVTVKVPKFSKYQKMADEAKICDAMLSRFSENHEDNQGALVICGGGGTGKTTLMSQLVHLHSDFLRSALKLTVVIWLNCFKCNGDAFDEGDFIKALIDLAEKGSEYSGFRSLEDVAEYFERENERLLIILDDVFNVRVLETISEHCASIPCIVVTRDVDELTARHGLVSEVYRLQELEDDEIVEMFENAYRLKGKLGREQFAELARLCSGLPIVVSLIAARFQDCQSSSDFLAEYELILEEIKVKDLKISGPYGTVSKLFQFSIEQLDDDFRRMYYAFLLYDPAEPVDVEDLAILWNCSNPHRALVRCRQLAKKSLTRPVISANSFSNANKPGDFYTVHQILHEAAVDNAIKTHRLATNLTDLRWEIICGFCEDKEEKEEKEDRALDFVSKALSNKRRHILETIFSHVSITALAKLARRKSEQLTKGRGFLHCLYNTTWPDNGPPTVTGANHSIRLLRTFFTRVVNFNQSTKSPDDKIDIPAILTENDASNDCLLMQFFKEADEMRPYRNDRRKLASFLYPINGCYKRYHQLRWFDEALKEQAMPLLRAAANGDLESVKKFATENPAWLRQPSGVTGDTPLIAASLMGHVDVVKFLCEFDPSEDHVNIVNSRCKNAFMFAATFDQLEIVKILYNAAANPTEQLEKFDDKRRTPMILAAMNCSVSVMQFLMEQRESLVDAAERYGLTSLIQASRFGHLEAVKLLLEKSKHNHDKEVDKNGNTALMYASMNGHFDVVKYLCEKAGSSVNQKSHLRRTAFMYAAAHGNFDVVRYLFDKDPREAMAACQKGNKTALVVAAEQKEVDVVRFLTEKCRRAMFSGDPANAPIWANLTSAAWYNYLNLVKSLIGKVDDQDQIDEEAVRLGLKHIKEAFKLARRHSKNSISEYLSQVVSKFDYRQNEEAAVQSDEDFPETDRILNLDEVF